LRIRGYLHEVKSLFVGDSLGIIDTEYPKLRTIDTD
jgi:hypothetical protein